MNGLDNWYNPRKSSYFGLDNVQSNQRRYVDEEEMRQYAPYFYKEILEALQTDPLAASDIFEPTTGRIDFSKIFQEPASQTPYDEYWTVPGLGEVTPGLRGVLENRLPTNQRFNIGNQANVPYYQSANEQYFQSPEFNPNPQPYPFATDPYKSTPYPIAPGNTAVTIPGNEVVGSEMPSLPTESLAPYQPEYLLDPETIKQMLGSVMQSISNLAPMEYKPFSYSNLARPTPAQTLPIGQNVTNPYKDIYSRLTNGVNINDIIRSLSGGMKSNEMPFGGYYNPSKSPYFGI